MDLLRSLPIGLYLEQPVTWLHRLDPRIKLLWLMSCLLTPVLANSWWRLALVAILVAITLTARIPLRVWKRQMGWLLMFCSLLFAVSCVFPDGITVEHSPRLPSSEISFLESPALGNSQQRAAQETSEPGNSFFKKLTGVFRGPSSQTAENSIGETDETLPQPTDYRYVVFQKGPLKITRRSIDLGIRTSTLLFTLIYSTNLFLLTTGSEEITTAIESWMKPLRWLKLPVTEIALTLTLALRFFPLVLEEVENLMQSVRTRAINWKKLGLRRAIQIWLLVAERVLENLLLRAEQISSAMQVRGFTSPNQHRVRWHQMRIRWFDWLAFLGLTLFWSVRLIWGGEV
ncbi:MAG: energy-coupling factor transporter transmembrane component T family protein [Microcoleaceae cyanobacterium]